jgi:hypothetical protein
MKVPNNEEVIISESKITEYLLSEKHPLGRYKAKFLKSLGFEIDNHEQFVDQLKAILKQNKVASKIDNKFSTKYLVECEIGLK